MEHSTGFFAFICVGFQLLSCKVLKGGGGGIDLSTIAIVMGKQLSVLCHNTLAWPSEFEVLSPMLQLLTTVLILQMWGESLELAH